LERLVPLDELVYLAATRTLAQSRIGVEHCAKGEWSGFPAARNNDRDRAGD
jgi:hypothetical protein